MYKIMYAFELFYKKYIHRCLRAFPMFITDFKQTVFQQHVSPEITQFIISVNVLNMVMTIV